MYVPDVCMVGCHLPGSGGLTDEKLLTFAALPQPGIELRQQTL